MKRKGFTLIEMVMVLTVIFILAAIGTWRIAGLREAASDTARQDALASVQRMQSLADMEGIPISAVDTIGRLVELEVKLAAKGHDYYQINPTNLAANVTFDASSQQWRTP